MTLQRNQSHGLNRALPWMAAALLLLAGLALLLGTRREGTHA